MQNTCDIWCFMMCQTFGATCGDCRWASSAARNIFFLFYGATLLQRDIYNVVWPKQGKKKFPGKVSLHWDLDNIFRCGDGFSKAFPCPYSHEPHGIILVLKFGCHLTGQRSRLVHLCCGRHEDISPDFPNQIMALWLKRSMLACSETGSTWEVLKTKLIYNNSDVELFKYDWWWSSKCNWFLNWFTVDFNGRLWRFSWLKKYLF